MDHEQIIIEVLRSTRIITGKLWKHLKPYAEIEFRKFSENAEYLAKLKLEGEISEDELKQRIIIQRTSLSDVLLTVEGMTLSMSQEVVNTVLGIVAKAVFASLKVILPV